MYLSMKSSSIVSILCLLGGLPSVSAKGSASFRGSVERRLEDSEQYYKCFENFLSKEDSVWPLAERDPDSGPLGPVSLPFGPYNSYCDGTDKFYRGISIHGNEGEGVQAIQPGVVDYVWESESGWNVRIKHRFETTCTFHEKNYLFFYSYYGHLSDVYVQEGDYVCGYIPNVSEGSCQDSPTIIGKLGTHTCPDGKALHVSLSHQIRLGTHETYAQCVDANKSGCTDPHVNPLLAQKKDSSSFEINVPATEDISFDQDLTVTVTQEGENYILNRVEVECTAGSQDEPTVPVIDFNKREDFDLDNSDAVDKHDPYIDATHTSVDLDANMYTATLIIPSNFFGGKEECVVTFYDVWGGKKYEKITLVSSSGDSTV